MVKVRQSRDEKSAQNVDRKATCVSSGHILGELHDGHPASSGNMNHSNNFDAILRDPPTPDLPSWVCRHIAVSHTLLTEGVN